MERFIEEDLQKWRLDPRRKPLLLRGARQVGKTFIVRKFGKQFKHFVEVNFERQPELREIFNSLDPKSILSTLEIALKTSVVPGDTLLFLDEIQECPKAILSLRYFKEEMENLHIVGAGSLLEFVLNDESFRMPVGRVQFLHLYPLSFFEFLKASGEERLLEYLRKIDLKHPVEEFLHQKLLKLIKQYTVLGGMPAVLEAFLQEGSYQRAQDIQTDLLATFRNDFGKYAKTSQHKYLQILFEKAPGLIAQWFKYSKVDPEMQARDLKRALQNLCDAGLIHLIYATSAGGLPLISSVNHKKFKLLFLDIGLVHRATRLDAETLMVEDLMLLNKGALAEQFAGQMLITKSCNREPAQLFFWIREERGSSAEVDFVTHLDSSIVPIEIKAGASGRLKSLKIFLEEKKIPMAVRVSQSKLLLEDNILSVPFYLIEELPRLYREGLKQLN